MQNIEINFGVRPCIVTQNGEESGKTSQSLLQQIYILAVAQRDK